MTDPQLTELIAETTRTHEADSSGVLRHHQWHTEQAQHLQQQLSEHGYSVVELPKSDDGQTWDIEAFTVFTEPDDEGVRVGIDEYDNHSGADRGVLRADAEYARRLALALLAAAAAAEEDQ